MVSIPDHSDFLLDPNVIFLNHGSFGACPRVVFETYQNWQRRLETQPVLFLGREMHDLDLQARQALAAYLHTDASNLVYVTNATYGVNIVSNSLDLAPGDEILTSDHEYGACEAAWEVACQRTGAIYQHQHIALPVNSAEEILEQFWQGVNERTKVIYLSHVTSPTALRLPVEAICARAREAGILTVIDGAHAPGQMTLDLDAIGADFYTGNCHKWMMSPKGAGFLYARPEVQEMVRPLVVSWGYRTVQTNGGPHFLDYLAWTGTRDPSAFLTVPAAIQYQESHDWDAVRQRCHKMLRDTIERICGVVDMPPYYPLDSDLYHQMGIAPLPPDVDTPTLSKRLYEEWHIEVPVIDWQGNKGLRISVQCYTAQSDLDTLVSAVQALLPVAKQVA